MSGTSRQWRDDGSGSGHSSGQRTADSEQHHTARRKASRAFFEHSTDGDDCGHGQMRCEEATKLLRAWRKLPS